MFCPSTAASKVNRALYDLLADGIPCTLLKRVMWVSGVLPSLWTLRAQSLERDEFSPPTLLTCDVGRGGEPKF